MAGDYEAERPEEEQEGGPVKSFLEHLEDLRWVLVKSVVALAIGMLVCLIAGPSVVGIINRPLSKAWASHPGTNQVVSVRFGTNQVGGLFYLTPEQQRSLALGTNRFVPVQVNLGTNGTLIWRVDPDPAASEAMQRVHIDLKNFGPVGGFFVAFQIAFYAGMVLAAPFISYFVASFVFPALKMRERKYVYRGVAYGLGLFVMGVAFCYFILMPVALTASQGYSQWLGYGADIWKAEDYNSFVCKFMLGMGLGFELPVVILTLVKIGVLNYRTLARARRYMIVINLILGAVLTTPEVVTQIVMFFPLQFLYELSVGVAWYWEQPNRAKARRRVALVIAIVALVVGLLWAAWRYGWPWLQTLNR